MRTQFVSIFVFIATFAIKAAAAEQISTGKHFLWRVTSAPAPFYLLGGSYLLRKADYPLAPVIEGAIKQSHKFIFEIDPRRNGEYRKLWQAAEHYPGGIQLQQKVSPKTFALLQGNRGSRTQDVSQLRPWAIAMSKLNFRGDLRASRTYGLDNYLQRRAASVQPHEFAGLDSPSEHIHTYSDMTDQESEKFLQVELIYADQVTQVFMRATDSWKKGDTSATWALFADKFSQGGGAYRRILDDSNARWTPRIEKAIKAGKPTLILAGALHFCGPNSVIALLRAHGYKIEQL